MVVDSFIYFDEVAGFAEDMHFSYIDKRLIVKNDFVGLLSRFLVYDFTVNAVISSCVNGYPCDLSIKIDTATVQNSLKLFHLILVESDKVL